MQEVGFDPAEFSRCTGRSIASVMLRARYLFSSRANVAAPVMGAWLFEADWGRAVRGSVSAESVTLRHYVSLAGFSQAKGTLEAGQFPQRGCNAGGFYITRSAFRSGKAVVRRLTLDRASSRTYQVIAVPQLRGGVPFRVLLGAVRNDCVEMVEPWLARLGVPLDARRFTSL